MNFNADKIYVLCPAYVKTGGTELLHQLVHSMNKEMLNVKLIYIGNIKKDEKFVPTFREYNINYDFSDNVEDIKENLLIIPETAYMEIVKYKYIQKVIWWLSVDNYSIHDGFKGRLQAYGIRSAVKHLILSDLEYPWLNVKSVQYHLCQSYYAIDYLKSRGIPSSHIAYLSDYINDSYCEAFSEQPRKDIVLYNPGKGYKFTKQLIKYRPKIQWIPIINMDIEQIRNLMRTSKVYIDFGNHPGKDRMPREAAISGCCIITGKRGSAKFREDVCIPENYKFNDRYYNVPLIVNKIEECINDYSNKSKDFVQYRDIIKHEKDEFIKTVKELWRTK